MFKKNESTNFEEESMNLATKEEEILDYYTEEEEDEEDFEEEIEQPEEIEEYRITEENNDEDSVETTESIEEDTDEYEEFVEEGALQQEKKYRKAKTIMNIVFIVIMTMIAMIAIDVISVAKYDKGPYFAIRTKKYNDGGTKEYYGIGYKVIKYYQEQGRRDMEVGFWNLKYNNTPITIQDIDLAIEMTGNEQKTYQKYYKKFVRIISTLQKVDTEKHQITMGYKDEDGKYSLDIICNIVPEQNNLSTLEEGKEITIIGTIKNFKGKTEKNNNRLYVENCFAEQ